MNASEQKIPPYELIGGAVMVRKISDSFYDIMDRAPEFARLRAMHAPDLSPMRVRLFEFLSGWLGGPPLYFMRSDHKCIGSVHGQYAIGEIERDEWLECMRRALDENGIADDVRTLLDPAFTRMAEALRNSSVT